MVCMWSHAFIVKTAQDVVTHFGEEHVMETSLS